MSIEHHASTYSVLIHTLDPWGGVKDILLKEVILHIKLKGKGSKAQLKHKKPYTLDVRFFSCTN